MSSCTKTTGLYISFGKLSSKSAFGEILYFNTIYTWPKRQSRWIFIYSYADCINVNKLKKCIVIIKFVQITDPPPYLTGIHLHRKLKEIVPWRTFKIESHCIPSFVDGNVLCSKVKNFWWIKTLLVHIFNLGSESFSTASFFKTKRHWIFPSSKPFLTNSSRSELHHLPLSSPEQDSQVQPHLCPGGSGDLAWTGLSYEAASDTEPKKVLQADFKTLLSHTFWLCPRSKMFLSICAFTKRLEWNLWNSMK